MLDARRVKPAVPEERCQAEPRSVRVITGITGLKKRSDLGSGREVGEGAGELAEGGGAGMCSQVGGGFGGALRCPKTWREDWPS